MKQQNLGLGRGLGALFNNDAIEPKITPMRDDAITQIAIGQIAPNPAQPRNNFAQEPLEQLAQSIGELGIIQPVTLRRTEDGKYLIISGERRWRAAKMAGLKSLPAYIREANDEELHTMALVENLQRADLNPIEIAIGLQRLIDECGATQEVAAQRLSMKRSTVSNYLRLLKLSDEIQYALQRGVITMGHAKALASMESEEQQLALLERCITGQISVREAERLASLTETQKAESGVVSPSYMEYSNRLASMLRNTIEPKRIAIKGDKSGGGKVVISFQSGEELERLIEQLESR